MLAAKIDVLVKLHPERPNQFTFKDVELLHRLQTAFKRASIGDHFMDIHKERIRRERVAWKKAKRAEEEQAR